jgi:hypothetical protein
VEVNSIRQKPYSKAQETTKGVVHFRSKTDPAKICQIEERAHEKFSL